MWKIASRICQLQRIFGENRDCVRGASPCQESLQEGRTAESLWVLPQYGKKPCGDPELSALRRIAASRTRT